MFCFGYGKHGQLGQGKFARPRSYLLAQPVDCALSPVQVEVLEAYEAVKRVTCGGNFTVAFSDSGNVYSWGEHRDLKVSSLRGLCPDLISSGALDTVVARCAYFFVLSTELCGVVFLEMMMCLASYLVFRAC